MVVSRLFGATIAGRPASILDAARPKSFRRYDALEAGAGPEVEEAAVEAGQRGRGGHSKRRAGQIALGAQNAFDTYPDDNPFGGVVGSAYLQCVCRWVHSAIGELRGTL